MESGDTDKKVLIMGIGNVLMGDEGVGVHVAEALSREALPEGIDVLDGGTGGFLLMPYFENYPCVVLIDATLDGRKPGTIRHLKPRFSAEFPTAMSTHDIGLKDLVEGLNILGKLPEVHLLAISIEDLQHMHIGLSAPVEKALPEIKSRALQLAGERLTDALT